MRELVLAMLNRHPKKRPKSKHILATLKKIDTKISRSKDEVLFKDFMSSEIATTVAQIAVIRKQVKASGY